MSTLSAGGGELGGSLVYIGDLRRVAVVDFQELAGNWSNALILLGMIGSAGYLVWHSPDFRPSVNDITAGLGGLLAIAPKAFAATVLALWGALWVSTAGGRELSLRLRQASDPSILVAAWSHSHRDQLAQQVNVALESGILARMEQLHRALATVANGTIQSVGVVQKGISSLSVQMEGLAGALQRVAVGTDAHLEQSKEILGNLSRLTVEAVALLARLDETEKNLSGAASRSIDRLEGVLDEQQRNLVRTTEEQQTALLGAFTRLQEKLAGDVAAQSEKLILEVSRRAPEVVESALSDSANALTKAVRAEGAAVETVIANLANNMAQALARKFNEAVRISVADVARLRNAAVELERTLSRLGGLVQNAGSQWEPQVVAATRSLDTLGAALERLGEAPGASVRSVGEMSRALDQLAASGRTAPPVIGVLARTMERACNDMAMAARQLGAQQGVLCAVEAELRDGSSGPAGS